jgi:cellulose synthase/poly-beta-1,6-N-acetylglucosamine synthase-like glycosyltransferase
MYDQSEPPSGRALVASVARPAPSANRDLARLAGREASGLFRSQRGEPAFKSRQKPAFPSVAPGAAARAALPAWPPEIAFLTYYGVSPSVLTAAAETACAQGVSADAALLATGAISEKRFYRSLARHLRLAFVDGPVPIAATAQYPQAVHAGLAPIAAGAVPAFLIAPRGPAIGYLITAADRGELRGRLAITFPTHLSRLLRAAFRVSITKDASFALSSFDPALCAKSKARRNSPFAAAGFSLLALFSLMTVAGSTSLCALLLGAVFLAMIFLRLIACAAAIEAVPPRRPQRLGDDALPFYSIVIALYREARMVPQLVAALEGLDYPAAKLDIKFVIEEDDAATFAALRQVVCPPRHEIIVAPAGAPRTKPRALNVALPLLRGQFVTVFDAEDIPEPQQIRQAAEHFAQAPPELACLQARLAINNLDDGWLPELFAIEYAVLFDVINIGFSDLHLPFPLGGSSNHFRTDVLREIGAWDAWNVTEDADIGFRLARFGYRAATFNSTTYEEAPTRISAFLGQRQRWCKGWYQTLFTLCRDPSRLLREVGILRGAVMIVTLLSSVLAPLGGPFGIVLLARTLLQGGPFWPSDNFEIFVATLTTSVFLGGAAAICWPIFCGMQRRRLLWLWPSLLLLPAYYALISFAAWSSLYDLIARPYHWCKTEHGLAGRRRRKKAEADAVWPKRLHKYGAAAAR